jgi:AcrR family transcriptional regulator
MPAEQPTELPPGLDLLWGRRGPGKRGPRPGLSPDLIVDAAIRLADAEGLEAVSMARVAAELGFTTMSLYRHVTSKEELLQLMWNASALSSEKVVLEGGSWRTRLRMWAEVQRAVIERHPWITQLPMAAPPLSPNSLAFVERGLATLDGTGLADGDKLRIIGLLTSYTLSEARMAHDALRAAKEQAARDQATAAAGGEPAPPWTFEALLRELVDEQTYPRLFRIAWTPLAEGDGDGDGPPSEHEQFLFGIDCILDGVQALIDRTRPALGRAVTRLPGSGVVTAPFPSSPSLPGPARDRQARRDVGVARVRQRHLVHRPVDVRAQRGAEPRLIGPAGVVGGEQEAVRESPAEVAHVAVTRVHQHQAGLVATALGGVPRRPAHYLGQVGGEPLDVLRMLARMRERVVQLRVGQAAFMQRGCERRERLLPARELVKRRSHACASYNEAIAREAGRQMASLVVWAVFIVFAVLLGLIAHNFSLSTVRWVSAISAIIMVCAITKYGIDHWHQAHSNTPPSNLVNAFTDGVDGLIRTLLRPLLLGYQGVAPGPIGRGVAALLLLLGYRQLESWTMRRQGPQLITATLGDGRLDIKTTGASADGSGARDRAADMTAAQLHDQLVAELKFRLAAIEVRAPAILPGGSRTIGLASIAETSGAPGAGLAGAILRFAGAIWPNPRQLELRVCVEPRDKETAAPAPPATRDVKVTVYLENPRNGATVATKTLVGGDINEAASMVAGYVARQVFTMDPSTPPWCYGSADGDDLAALLLAGLERVRPETPDVVETSRDAQINQLWESASTFRSAGVAKYELAQLLVLDDYHLAALRLHAMNLDEHPRFYRGRYRLGMSLEMIASPKPKLRDDDDPRRQLDEILGIFTRRGLPVRARTQPSDLTPCADDTTLCTLSRSLSLELLTVAARELRGVRAQLTLRRVVWDTFRYRNERAVWLQYWTWLPGWGLRRRWAFHDAVLVAELLVAIRIKLIEGDVKADEKAEVTADGGKPEDGDTRLPGALSAVVALVDENVRHGRYESAIRIASAIADEASDVAEEVRRGKIKTIRRVLTQGTAGKAAGWWRVASGALPLWHWLSALWHKRRAKASWQAAYNAACLYAALVDKEADQDLVVACLRSAIANPRSELERAFDWISRDPDLSFLKDRDTSQEPDPANTDGTPFKKFLDTQERLDYPAAFPAERPVARRPARRGRSDEQPRPSKADLTTAGDG